MKQYEGAKPIHEFKIDFRTGIWLEENCEGIRIKSRISETDLLVRSDGKVSMVSQIPAVFVGSMIQGLIKEGWDLSLIEFIDWKEVSREQLTLLDFHTISAATEYLVLPIVL